MTDAPNLKWDNIRPVKTELAADVLRQWRGQQDVLHRHQRGAVAGQGVPYDFRPAPSTEPLSILNRRAHEKQALEDKLITLFQHGVEIEYLAQRFGISRFRVRAIVNAGSESFDDEA